MATVALGQKQTGSQTRAFVIAWVFTVVFYFLEYAVRSSPAVMIPQLEASFHTTALGLSAILGAYYYTYSTMSLIAGAALDHLGAKRTVPVGAAILGIGCLFFSAASVLSGDIGRLLQGAGSAFAFTGAVYLASHGFSARYLATAIGATQCVGMLGGSAGQSVVGPMIEGGLDVHVIWVGLGVIILAVAVCLFFATPKEQFGPHTQEGGIGSLLKPYKIVFSNPQSYLCGIVAGLLFAPTTIGDMIWGVASFQKDLQLPFRMSPGWMAFGSHRKKKAGDHRQRDGNGFGCRPARAQTHTNSRARGDVRIRCRIGCGNDSLQRHQRSQSRQREGQRNWRD
jgi:MFS family permease